MRPANCPGLNQHPDYLKGFYPYEEQMDAIVLWNKNTDIVKESTFPPVNYTGEEATKSANIQAAALDNLDAAISNIILGKASIKEYDKAVKAAVCEIAKGKVHVIPAPEVEEESEEEIVYKDFTDTLDTGAEE